MVTGRKLLLADDSVTIQKVVDLTFSDEGLEVVTVGDGQQALEMLEEFTPDIVLADVFMPGLNGYQLCEQIKRDERLSHIPVLLLVGSFEPFDEEEARRVGADDFLTKPFQSIRTLIGKVRNLLTGGGATDQSEQPTRQLAPPPEAEKENRPDTDFLERTTADTAPLPDAHAGEASPAAHAREVPFADLSMDDEMIETTPAGGFESAKAEVQSRGTAQYSAADLREAGIMQNVETEPARETVGAFAPAQEVEPAPAASAQQLQQTPARASSFAPADDSLLDLGDIELPPPAVESDDFLFDLLDESQPQASAQAATEQHASPYPDVFAPPAEAAPAQVAEETSATFEEAAAEPQAQEFVDAQVVGGEADASRAPADVEAAATAEQEPPAWQETSTFSPSAPTERLPEDYHAEGAAAASPSAAQHAGQITLEQLSPEVIDAIARRAVEQLSERTVEQIAWEVVPQLAELLIKRRLEEEKQ